MNASNKRVTNDGTMTLREVGDELLRIDHQLTDVIRQAVSDLAGLQDRIEHLRSVVHARVDEQAA